MAQNGQPSAIICAASAMASPMKDAGRCLLYFSSFSRRAFFSVSISYREYLGFDWMEMNTSRAKIIVGWPYTHL